MVCVVVVWWEIEGGDYGGLEVVVIGKGFLAGFPGGEKAVGIELRGALCVCSCMFGHFLSTRGAMLARLQYDIKCQDSALSNYRSLITARQFQSMSRSYVPFP